MAKPEPILFLNHDLSSGGAEHALLKLLQGLDRSRFTPSVWVREMQGDLLPQYQELGIELQKVPGVMSEGARRWLMLKVLTHSLKLRRFSLVHSFCSNAWWTEPWCAKVAGVRGYIIRKSDRYRHGPARSWEVREQKADRIVCVTSSIYDEFYRGTPLESKARVILNGLDTNRFRPLPADPAVRREMDVPEGAPLFACVANLSNYKGQMQLLIGLAWAKANDIPLYIAFAGRDLSHGQMYGWAEQFGVLDRARFLGRVSDVPRLLANCDGMALMSPSEGCSNAVLEAMSCGVPVIVSASGTHELIEDGHTGYVVPVGGFRQCIERMCELSRQPELRARVGGQARQRILEKFNLGRMAADYMDLYDELLAGQPAGAVNANRAFTTPVSAVPGTGSLHGVSQ